MEGPFFPLFCTTDAPPEVINGVLKAAADEEGKDARFRNSWVLVQLRDQTIFPVPTPQVQRVESEFIDAGVDELGKFCKTRFESTGLICNEDFGIIDKRSLKDQTILFARWEQYTPEDDAILRIVWGEATPQDEAWLQSLIRSPEDLALLRKVRGKATISDEAILLKAKDDALREDRPALAAVQEAQEEAIRNEEDPRSDATQPDRTFLQAVEKESKAETKSKGKANAKEGNAVQKAPLASAWQLDQGTTTQTGQTAEASQHQSGQRPKSVIQQLDLTQVANSNQPPLTPLLKRTSRAFEMVEMSKILDAPVASNVQGDRDHPDRIEIVEGWRMMRVPIATSMQDTDLIFRYSITDLKIRQLFDRYGVLRY